MSLKFDTFGHFIISKMMPRTGLISLIFIAFAFTATAQKVKYKDLYLLLSTKEYQKAEPFLKRYLKENTDNPNAYLFMGIIYNEKANHADVLKQPEVVGLYIDSAILNYSTALRTITEKEVRRNDEYYESYRRRDLRTAESGIKLSDIQFDLEQRIKGLKEKKERVTQLKLNFIESESSYKHANLYYQKIQHTFPEQRDLLLRADDKTIGEMKAIISASDSSARAFSNYKSVSQLIGKTGYNQIIDPKEIRNLHTDGSSMADFYENDLKLWDYKQWATSTIDILEKQIFPLRDQLIVMDIDINKLRAKLAKDSSSVEVALNNILKNASVDQLKKFDEDPMPLAVFRMKKAEIEYIAETINTSRIKDSTDMNLRLAACKKEWKKARALDSLATLLSSRDLARDMMNYHHFVANAYGTDEVLTSLIRTTKDYADRESAKKKREEERRVKSLNWLVSAPDSIPLFIDPAFKKSKFKPLAIMADDNTSGIKYVDSLATGYFYTITPSRIPDVKAAFPLPAVGFTKRNLPIIKAITTHDEKGQVYYSLIYSEAKTKEKFTAIIAKIYRTDGLAWSRTYLLDMIPASMSFAGDSGELSIKVSNPAGDNKIVVIDKTGKQLQ